MSATGSYERLPPDAYNKNSIGQRGGDVRVPLAQVGPSAGTRPGDPMGKQAAALIVSMSPYPLRTLRDGLVNGGRDASAIRVPLARVTPTEAEIATRISQEAKSETPSSAMPVTLNQAIELLKAAEEGWQGNDVDYEALLADAQRLKAIRAVAKRRPIRDDEQALINSLADKYSGAIETAVSDSSRRQQALIAKQADPSAQGVADADAMRAAIAARFAPHDRAKVAAANQQAAAIDRVLGPRFDALPKEAAVLARDTAQRADQVKAIRIIRTEYLTELGKKPDRSEVNTQLDSMNTSLGSMDKSLGQVASAVTGADVTIKVQSVSAKAAKKASDLQPTITKILTGPSGSFTTSRTTSSSSSSSSSSVPDAVVDPNDIGGVVPSNA
jgi:hypothetical protein